MVSNSTGIEPTSWASRTYRDVVETAETDGSILVLPIGSIEQHGHHLPVATDSLLVTAIAELGAARVIDDVPILVAPSLWTGYSPHHLPFGGTLSLEFDTMLDTVEEVADAALSNGFDALVLLNGHGGNKPLVSAATSTIGKDHPDAEILGLTYFDLAEPFIDDVRDSDPGGMAHGGEFETSLMIHLYPDLVREDMMEAPHMDEPYGHASQDLLDGATLSVYRGFDEYTESGAIGEPTAASAEKGAHIYELLGDELESLLCQIHATNR